MAPYCGPSLPMLVKTLAKGEVPWALGTGVPQAQFERGPDGVLELRGLSGGAGFGVQADMVQPFVDAGVLVRGEWQEIIAWLCEHWSYGEPWGSGERLHVRFAGQPHGLGAALERELAIAGGQAQEMVEQGVVLVTLEQAGAVCKAARIAGARMEFEVVKVRVVYDVVVEDCGGKGARFHEKIKARVSVGHAASLALARNEPCTIYSTDREDHAQHVLGIADKVRGVRVKLVVRRAP
jgi:hypothetical protein